MKALVMISHGDLSQLKVTEVLEPDVTQPGHVRVRLRAAALNHLDLWSLRGLPGLEFSFPHILGADGAGEIDQVGEGVTTVARGDRVMINPGVPCYHCEYCLGGEHPLCADFKLLGEHLQGTLAEYVVLPEHNVALIPTPPSPHSDIAWSEAAAYSLVTITAWRMLVTRAQLRPGELVLIWGIGGGVSGAALMIAKHLGARAIVTSSSDEKLDGARQMGADLALNHAKDDVVKEVRAYTGKRGVDVVVENVGEATWEHSLRLLAKKGRLVTCGATTGPRAVADIRRMFWNQWTVMGSTMGSHSEYREIARLLGQGHLRPLVDSVHPLSDALAAFKRLESGEQFGKVVVEVGG
jgi:NADPH:quinone reductase-like Zn-dependent oxidoreductase